MRIDKLLRMSFASVTLAFLAVTAVGCAESARHSAAMAEARRVRGQTAYDGRPSFGEPYGEWGREKLKEKWGN